MQTISNGTLMEKGYAPTNRDGEKIYLQHIGNFPGSPTAELTKTQCATILSKAYTIDETIDRETVAREKRNYWRNRINITK